MNWNSTSPRESRSDSAQEAVGRGASIGEGGEAVYGVGDAREQDHDRQHAETGPPAAQSVAQKPSQNGKEGEDGAVREYGERVRRTHPYRKSKIEFTYFTTNSSLCPPFSILFLRYFNSV